MPEPTTDVNRALRQGSALRFSGARTAEVHSDGTVRLDETAYHAFKSLKQQV
jgi:hypothetical protein